MIIKYQIISLDHLSKNIHMKKNILLGLAAPEKNPASINTL